MRTTCGRSPRDSAAVANGSGYVDARIVHKETLSLYNLENDMTDHLPCSMLLAYGVWHAVARGEGCTLVAYTGAHNEIRT